MEFRNGPRRTPLSAGLDHGEDMLAEVEEPPDSGDHGYFFKRTHGFETSPPARYEKQMPLNSRRESLLTRQLHSETEHTEDESHEQPPLRGLSMVSNWSNHSTTSTAELTSDDGRSVTSPATSPPLPPTHVRNGLPITDRPLTHEPRIVGLDHIAAQGNTKDAAAEKAMEDGLARRRCISFACGNKEKSKPPTPPPSTEPEKSPSPPKRKCMIKFACPTRAGAENKPAESQQAKRPVSPPPPQRQVSQPGKVEKAHRGSDSTVTHVSPRNARKSPSASVSASSLEAVSAKASPRPIQRKLSNDSDDSGGEGTRFHEFANSDEEPEEWVQESTCHRNRLTVSDTLKKENVIRKLGQEVDDEVLEEDEGDLEEDDADGLDDDDEADDDDEEDDEAEEDEDEDEDDVSDAGFRTDDEEGFAASDDESGDSDYEWWTPATGRSTAATSTDHLDHIGVATATHIRADRIESGSSISSAGSGHVSPRSQRRNRRRGHTVTQSINIDRPVTPDLPDSTDFVCGTLDEDRPSEQAYLNHMKEREASKHKVVPQDIDPTFPTSDPEMDEEDDEDLDDQASESEVQLHGEMEELHGDVTARRRRSPPSHRRSTAKSPPPPARRKSPAPVRHKSPAPRHRSPAPRAKSPAPAPRRSICRSPPPAKRGSVRSPAPPRKLFGQSPKRARSPAPGATRMTSPPNTRRASPTARSDAIPMPLAGLGARPSQLTHTASLPRAGGFQISRMARLVAHNDDESDSNDGGAPKKRGAIDIVKGLEKKRLRRKEKLQAKAAAKAAAKGEKPYKVKPGKGCERMREVGLELQRYKGKGEHILSV